MANVQIKSEKLTPFGGKFPIMEQFAVLLDQTIGSPDKPGGLSIQLCKSEKKEFYIRYSS